MPTTPNEIPNNKLPLNDANQLLFDFAKRIIKEGKLDKISSAKIEKALEEFRKDAVNKTEKFQKIILSILRTKFKKAFNQYINGGYLSTNPKIAGVKMKDLAPAFRKELKNAIDTSLGLIKTQNTQTMLKLEQRFRNWANVPSKSLRGSLTDPDKMISTLKNEIIDDPQTRYQTKKHLQFILNDQTRKMLGSMDKVTATKLGAIGFIWKTRIDSRVVGNPGGLYPKASNPTVHGNHYKRDGKFYLYRDTWAVKDGYLIARDGVIYADQIEDGLPSVPIGCRCMASNVYHLEDIPKDAHGIVTKKGQEFIDRIV